MFKKSAAPKTSSKNYLLTYQIFNRHLSLTKPVAVGSYSLTSDGPVNEIPAISSMTDFVTKEVIDSLDTETIGAHNDLTPEQLKPDYFTVVFTSVNRVY